MTHPLPVLAIFTLLSLACSAPNEAAAPAAELATPTAGTTNGGATNGGVTSGGATNAGGSGAEATSAGSSGAGGTAPNPAGRTRCVAPAGFVASPGTIDEAVQWLNALPKPTTAACFLESLPRPLRVFATNSQFSAQPALSTASPRVFLELDRLWVSAVIDGASSYLIEFGYRPTDADLDSIKGELELPLTDVISANAPYERARIGSGTTCGFCHRSERAVPELSPDAFVSAALRPRPESYVSVAALQAEHGACNWSENEHRCEMLASIFAGGDVVETAFPATMPTFF
jgi:hypothetical protein